MSTISQLAHAGGVGVETIRYYQRRGLLATPGRGQSGRGVRHYEANDLRRLKFIRAAQAAGFTLDQIGILLQLDSTHDRATARQMARERIAALDEKIAELQASRNSLQRLARECGSGRAGPCPIIESFESG